MSYRSYLTRSFGLEDNASVEVNFNIDTNADGAVEAPISEPTSTQSDELSDSVVEVNENEAEAERAEDEVDELNEAQDSLESLGSILDKYASQGGISPMAAGFYRMSVENILGKQVAANFKIPTMEEFSSSRARATVTTLESHAVIMDELNQISMEAMGDWWKKVKLSLASIIKTEGVIEQRALKLANLAKGTEDERPTNEKIKVNQPKLTTKGTNLFGLNIKRLTHLSWNSDTEFLHHYKNYSGFFKDLGDPVYSSNEREVINSVFGAKQYYKKEGENLVFDSFGGKFVKLPDTVHYQPDVNDSPTEVVNLSPKVIIEIANDIVNLVNRNSSARNIAHRLEADHTKIVATKGTAVGTDGKIVGTSSMSEAVDEGKRMAYENTISALHRMHATRAKVLTEVLNYCFTCLNDRTANETVE